jgi:DNA polymerase III epsilon subunit-like protein
MNIIVFDTETTGLIKPHMIELACLYKRENEEIKNITFKVKPDVPIMPSATIIHGITQAEAQTYPEADQAIDAIYTFLSTFPSDTLFVAHNISFDTSVLNHMFDKYLYKTFEPKNTLDTIKFAKKMISKSDIGGYKLDAVFYYLFPDKLKYLFESRVIHDADTDCSLTYQVLVELKNRLDQKNGTTSEWSELAEFIELPMDLSEGTWAFGKHKGIKFKDTPKGYIRWCLTSDFGQDAKNADIIYTLKKYEN